MSNDHPRADIINGLLVPADPEQPVAVVVLNHDAEPPYKALQRHVDGLIDVVGLDEGDVWVNDEGRLLELPLNVRASHWMLHESIAGREGRIGESLMVYGNVVLTGPPDVEGDTTSVSPELVRHFQSLNIHPSAMKDWDVRSTDLTVQTWGIADEPPSPGLDLDL